MAKHCDVCNKSYPDTEAHCPHCAAAADSAVNLGGPFVAEVAGSSGSLVAEPERPSGDSVVTWSALVEEAPSEEGGPGSAKIDSPSDVDLLGHAPAVAASDSAVGGEPFVAEIDSGVELPGATVTETPPPAPVSGSDAAVGGEPFVAEVASSGELSSGAFVAEVADEEPSSAIDLGALAAGRGEAVPDLELGSDSRAGSGH